MQLRIYDPRILAVDLRHRRFGYAVFEGHRRLQDWGTRVYPETGYLEAEMARRRLASLLKLFSPSVIVLKRERWGMAETNSRMRSLIEAVAREALAHSIPVRLIGQEDVRSTFHNLGCETREEIAAALARIFPELVWDLPPKRRPWDSDHSRMTTFDAIALGLAYWQHSSTPARPPPE